MLVVDPPRGFTLDGDRYRLRRRWLSSLALVGDNGDEWCLPFLLEQLKLSDADWLSERLRDDNDDLDIFDIWPVAVRVADMAFGMSWWTAARLYGVASNSWIVIDGKLSSGGVDLRKLLDETPARGLAVVRSVLLSGQRNDEDYGEVERKLDTPPPNVPLSRSAIQDMADQWLSAAGAMNGRI